MRLTLFSAALAVLLLFGDDAQTATQKRRPRRVTQEKQRLSSLSLSVGLKEAENNANNGWRLATFSDGGMFVFYNKARITKLGAVTRTWLKTYQMNKPNATRLYALEQHEFNCTTQEHRLAYMTEYGKGGLANKSYDFSHTGWRPIVPDTVLEGMFGIICKNEKSTADLEESLAATLYEGGQWNEQQGDYAKALDDYENALGSSPFNEKYREAVERVKRLMKR